MSTKTKSFSSDMTGLPALSGTAGALIAILDAVLVNGYGSTGVVSLSVTGSVATATYASGHPFKVDTVAAFAGATPAGLNGEKRILTVAANTVTFDATGIAAGAATGTITSKVAAAGWVKLFAGTNLAAYKIAAVEGTGCILRVDDTGTTTARIRGYESMSDINTGTGPFPTVSQVGGAGLWWSKSAAADGTARMWSINADAQAFYFYPAPESTKDRQADFFGDVESYRSNDPYSCLIRGNEADKTSLTGSYGDDLQYNDPAGAFVGAYMPRSATAIGGSQRVSTAALFGPRTSPVTFGGSTGFVFPSPVDNGLIVAKVVVWSDTGGIRATMPGLFASPQMLLSHFAGGDVIQGTGDLVGRQLHVVATGARTIETQSGRLFLDTNGSWRV